MKFRINSIAGMITVSILFILFASNILFAQNGRIETHDFHSSSLEANLIGDPSEGNVIVYLPPGYDINKNKQYPVLYLLHGNSASIEGIINQNTIWIDGHFQGMNMKNTMDSLQKIKAVREMIIAMPNGRNLYRGSHYVNSPVTGNWADHIAIDLVKFMDSNYRTIQSPDSRGLCGHSMGGRGALLLGMKYPNVFGSIYGMSSGEMEFSELNQSNDYEWWSKLYQLKDIKQANPKMVRMIGLAAAFSPNPDNPPFYVDLPFKLVNDSVSLIPEIQQKWLAFDPVALVPDNEEGLNCLKAIRFDCGTSDWIVGGNRAFSKALSDIGILHVYEEYEGAHSNCIRKRVENYVLPYFSEVLSFN